MSSDFLVNYILMVALLLCLDTQRCLVSCGGAPGDTVVLPGPGVSSSRYHGAGSGSHQHHPHPSQAPHHQQSAVTAPAAVHQGHAIASSGQPPRNSYAMLSAAMSHAVSNEFSSLGSGSADGSCHADDLDCFGGSVQDRLGMEAIKSLHRQLDDDDNGNIDLSESDDFLREELKYDSGYEKRHKAFHYNDDMHISVKELWEAWLRSEVHNWTVEQTTDWLAQSVQLPQYVDLFRLHKVTGAVLPRLAVNNMHYVSNVLGIKDPIHKQKIALKAMDVVLFGPPRETGTRWKDYILVTLLLSAIIGCWYAYQQNKNAKKHLRRMAQDMEGLQKAENALQEMQKELERARMEQENVATEKLDLERRLKEAPSLTSSSSDLELQQLKQEIEMLRSELSRAEVELVDHCWSPPPQLQSWLQYTYELENKNHLKKRVQAEKQLQGAREACEKLKRKRSSLVGAFVSTHGKSIDDVDRSIVEARNALSEVTNELQERLHRWKQIELLLGFSIVNNNGLPYLENVLYSRNGSGKSARGRLTNSTDDLDDDSVQGMLDNYSRNSSGGGRDDSSASDDGDNQSVQFFVGGAPAPSLAPHHNTVQSSSNSLSNINVNSISSSSAANTPTSIQQQSPLNSYSEYNSHASSHNLLDDSRSSPSISSERSVTIPPRSKKPNLAAVSQSIIGGVGSGSVGVAGRAPLPPPRRTNSHQSYIVRSQSSDTVPTEFTFHALSSTHFPTAAIVTGTVTGNIGSITSSSSIPSGPGVPVIGPGGVCGTLHQIPSSQSIASLLGSQSAAVAGPINPTTAYAIPPSLPSSLSSATNVPACIAGTAASTSNPATTATSPFSPATVTSTTHGDPQMEDTNSTDSSSIDGEFKKRRRKLHFPFGKKSNKSKLA
ncbi:unnamed protein product [Hermetia illucens]|nr:unnamed protein product [Hermetia illucens]